MCNWKLFGFVIILLIGAGQITVHADEASHRQAVEQLLM